MNVYEISTEIAKIETAIDEAGGVVTPEVEEMLNALSNARSDKLQALAKLIKKNQGDGVLIDHEIERLRSLRKTVDSKHASLEKLVRVLLMVGETWQEGSDRFSWRKCPPSLELADGIEVDDCYKRVEVKERIDAEKIKLDLKGGATIPGAQLVTKFNLVVR